MSYEQLRDELAKVTKQRDDARALSKEYFDKLNGWQAACIQAEKQRDDLQHELAQTKAAMVAQAEGLTKQRDDLLAALEQVTKHIREWQDKYGKFSPEWLPPAFGVQVMEMADAAIASTKGGA